MAGRSRDAATYQTHFQTNRHVGETVGSYGALVREDAAVTRCGYVVLVAVFGVNLLMSLGLLLFAVRAGQPPSPVARCWSPTSTNPDDWLVCRHCAPGREPTRQCSEVVNEDFCHAALEVFIVIIIIVVVHIIIIIIIIV